MNKSSLILKFFQKAHLLTVINPAYCQTISTLFKWMIDNDQIHRDITTQFLNLKSTTIAKIISREDATTAGIEEITYLLKKITHLSFSPYKKDGEKIKKNQTIAEIKGQAREILAHERIILNILQRMSGIATATNRLINLINVGDAKEGSQIPASPALSPSKVEGDFEDVSGKLSRQDPLLIAATRKTPWMSLDKKAVAVGGGLTHRLNLSDGILIKDNHLANISVAEALKTVFNKVKGELIEIEVKNEKEAISALTTYQKLTTYNSPARNASNIADAGGQPITYNHLAIMFDNFHPENAVKTIEKLKQQFALSQIIFEASGGINEENIKKWAKTGVNLISIGFLTHSPQAVNLSLEFS
jgi:nicotinate-nucleotide pyrophosphorylase (carboxylating)